MLLCGIRKASIPIFAIDDHWISIIHFVLSLGQSELQKIVMVSRASLSFVDGKKHRS